MTGYTAVSEGQRQHIDYLLSTVNDDLAWVALVVIKEYGLPAKDNYREYLSQFASWGLDEESDQLALELLYQAGHSDWDALLSRADPVPAEVLKEWTEDLLGPDIRQQSLYNPVTLAWENALSTGNSIDVDIYQAEVERKYGVAFAKTAEASEWDLLGIRMAHVAFDRAARAFGEWARRKDIFWDDATAFRRIMGEITLLNSDTVSDRAVAIVEGRTIKIFWSDKQDRTKYVIPNLMLHELGHIFNANAGFGDREGAGSINTADNHPLNREGMGDPVRQELLGSLTIESDMVAAPLPQVFQEIGAPSPDHFIFDKAPHIATQIQSLQQSLETYDPTDELYYRLDGRNEVTADAVLNWFYHQSTGGVYGFTPDQAGLNWQRFMDQNMDVAIRNATVYNALRDNSHVPFFVEEKTLPHFAGFTRTKAAGVNVRTEPSTAGGKNTVIRSLKLGDEVAVIGQTEGGFNGEDNNWTAIIWNGRKRWVASHLLTSTENEPAQVGKDDPFFDFEPSSPAVEEWNLFFDLARYLGEGVANAQ
ncbi:MAG: SH3 domain-containing protein [Chloroflexi bacterium]|nr:SH3 domain-containing protein [Chloroflexota bacterium]